MSDPEYEALARIEATSEFIGKKEQATKKRVLVITGVSTFLILLIVSSFVVLTLRTKSFEGKIGAVNSILTSENSTLLRQRDEYRATLSQIPGTGVPTVPQPPAACNADQEAQANLRWIAEDRGARARYNAARLAGMSRASAVVSAQAHNSSAVNSLFRYGDTCVEAYAESLGLQ